MTSRVRILFRVNADAALGLGHVSRMRALMQALLSQAACRFAVVTNNKEIVRQLLSGMDFDLYGEGELTPAAHFDAAVVDVPDPGAVKESFHEIADLLVCVDDNGAGLSGQDILIRPNLLGLPRPAGMAEERYWPGQIILHPDFAAKALLPIRKVSGARELFVCFGGSDPCGITLRAVNVLKRLDKEVRIRIILGAAFPWDEKLAPLLSREARFLVSRNIPDVAQVLQQADVALISGGTLLYEACALGVPSVVVCQNEEQRAEADVAHAAGAVINLGTNAKVLDENILSAVERLWTDAALREEMSSRGVSLVAADGAARLAARLLTYMRKRSEA